MNKYDNLLLSQKESTTNIFCAKRIYIPIKYKFYIALLSATIWLIFSIYVSKSWLYELAELTNMFWSILIIGGIAYVPGWINTFLIVSLLIDRQPYLAEESPKEPITLLVSAYNEEIGIYDTLQYLANQDYEGELKVIVINNNSTDQTVSEVHKAMQALELDISCIDEPTPGKFNALNTGLKHVMTNYVITLDADTVLHRSAIRYLVARIEKSADDIKAVAGSMLVRNSRDNLLARVQEWDYFLSIASIKRMQGLYQGTLVAQGAFSIYKTSALHEVGGWSDAIGEDIVLTWDLLQRGYRVYFEPLAVAFTDVPIQLNHFVKQRSRWARGMIEGLRKVKPWQQPIIYHKFLTGIDLFIPYMDFAFTCFWIPGLILALFGHYYIVGPMIILVFPLTCLTFYILFIYQKRQVFDRLGLNVRKNKRGLFLFVLCYQMIMSPVSLYGYLQELLNMKRVWK